MPSADFSAGNDPVPADLILLSRRRPPVTVSSGRSRPVTAHTLFPITNATRLMALTLLCLAASPGVSPAQTDISPSLRNTLAWQLALEREGFSPGVIDGRLGSKTQFATKEFQRAHNLPSTGKLDEATQSALNITPDNCLGTCTIQPADQDAVTGVPKKWQEKAAMKYLGYEAIVDGIAERFHCSPALLGLLNPGVDLATLAPGQTLTVPKLGELKMPPAHHLVIDLSRKTISVFNADNQLVALFHCSIAAHAEKRPRGSARVIGITHNPAYSFDPAMWPEVKDVTSRLLIPPGPRNPVGMCWIGLNLSGYGIHGTPYPHLIGKTGSHGCFRLTNWDATRLGKMLTPGTPITFVESAPAR